MATGAHPWKAIVKKHLEISGRPLLVVLGPTASGKTAFSVDLAEWISAELRKTAEVVNADSRQLYRFMDIGTAKTTREEMRGVPHHLIDVLDPDEEITAGKFQTMARDAIDGILARGNVPLLVGGSMLYVSAVIDGLTLGPASDAALRKRLMEEFAADGGKTLFARLRKTDPDTAATIDRKNAPRLVRAVEICELSGEKKSTNVPSRELRSGGGDSGYDTLLLGAFPERETLMRRIDERVEGMIEDGWIDEVRGLLERGYDENDPGMKAAGYGEIVRFIREGEGDRNALVAYIAKKTRNYAKRQISWWRNDERIVPVHAARGW